MPHKHTRREKDESTSFDLPPSQIAKPLPPTTISKKKKAGQKKTDDVPKKSGQKRKRGGADADDAPRAFKRLMAFANGKTPRDGLDNDPSAAAPTAQDLKIRPGERLSEFSRRVDAALPISGLVHKTVKNGKDPLGLKVRRTKKERKMQNMYAEWRKIDRKIKERREEERELAEERELENEALGVSWKLELEAAAGQGKKKGGKKGKRRRLIGEVGGPEGDPWEEIKKKRGEAKVGLNDVAQAPPELKLPRKNLLVRGAAVAVEDIPKAAGSLRQREELQGIRQEVVASYRRMMSERRPALGT
ncbi:uncharacterized protein THITE_39085 [Thermothielavioides terrestris NRRL 8126]|uniref:Urease accessory protein UreD n=1 Tax=Thermothielavioides terrestris (strain ATCC 38088 / NRRL 8126) TaxID=578455 RepID=G2QS07_THETT|nr:uncharacterized protein THITE_39085 [Thermothielavioides terrestris NRRL 8126]AEO62594.1 hypothetical protein THITE_39085 [Thermothielavioides terrestris NRRL 8126]